MCPPIHAKCMSILALFPNAAAHTGRGDVARNQCNLLEPRKPFGAFPYRSLSRDKIVAPPICTALSWALPIMGKI
jgi:hypothetical protein